MTQGLSPADAKLVPILRRLGVVVPIRAIQACMKTGLPIALGASVLMQESAGGRNLWGHDSSIFVGGYDAEHHHDYGPIVTKAGYLAYKAERGPTGRGGMQGVGPLQLTYFSFQDEADKAGGCWLIMPNLLTGFSHLAANIRRDGFESGVAAYNGSGPAADQYARTVLSRADTYARALSRPYR